MAKRDSADDKTALDDALIVIDGAPVVFEVGGRDWHLRQPTPAETVRIAMSFDVAHHRAWGEVEASGMSKTDIASMVSDAQRIGYWTAKHEAEENQDARREIADRIIELQRADKSSAWDEITMAFALAERDRYALNLLLEDDDKAELLASPGAVREARQYVQRVLILANIVPNWQGRTAS